MGLHLARRPRLLLLTGLCAWLQASTALAQYSHAIFLELVRDPGRADVPRSARSLAMAGDDLSAGGAEAAVTSPGALMLGTGTDWVFSAGAAMYGRDELVETPRQLPPFEPARSAGAHSSTPVGFAGVAARGQHWAAAGFFDRSARLEHTFTTRKAELFQTALFPTLVIESGTGTASLSQSTTRIGGSLAVGSRSKRLGAGVSVSAVRVRYVAQATDSIEVVTRSFDLVTRTFCCVVDEDGVAFDEWKPAIAASGVFAPVAHLTLTARWRHDPAYSTTRQLTVTRQSQEDVFTQDVHFDVPDVYGFGAIVAGGGTMASVEVSRARYARVFSPTMSATFDPNYVCGTVTVAQCAGWNFPYHETKDATTVRAGVEQQMPLGRGRIVLRAGLAHEAGYTLARSASDESTRRRLSLPAPPIVTSLEPPREDSTWLSGGVGYAWDGGEIAFGVGHINAQSRVLVDLRLRR